MNAIKIITRPKTNSCLSFSDPQLCSKTTLPAQWTGFGGSVGVVIHAILNSDVRTAGPITYRVTMSAADLRVELIKGRIVDYLPKGEQLLSEIPLKLQFELKEKTGSSGQVKSTLSSMPSVGAGVAASEEQATTVKHEFSKTLKRCSFHLQSEYDGYWTIATIKGEKCLVGEGDFYVLSEPLPLDHDKVFREAIEQLCATHDLSLQELMEEAQAEECILLHVTLSATPAYDRIYRVSKGEEKEMSNPKRWVYELIFKANTDIEEASVVFELFSKK